MTTALVVAAAAMAPRLRARVLAYLAAVAVTRMTFGAHFPLDVVVGTIVGWQVGLFSVARHARGAPPACGAGATPGAELRGAGPARRAASASAGRRDRSPIAMPSAAPTSTSSQK